MEANFQKQQDKEDGLLACWQEEMFSENFTCPEHRYATSRTFILEFFLLTVLLEPVKNVTD